MTGNVLSEVTGYMLGRTPNPETQNNFSFCVICATGLYDHFINFVGLQEHVQAL